MAQRSDGGPADPRAAFAAALARLRAAVPDASDEVLARRASATALPSGRRITVNARRLGEWFNGRSVPRDFEQVLAVVQAVAAMTAAAGVAAGPPPQQWRRLWRDAHEHRAERPAGPVPTAADLVVGRPPSDAVALRERTPLADAIDAALADPAVRQVVLTGPGGSGKSQLAAAAFHRCRSDGGVHVWVPASSRQSVLTAYARAWRALAADRDGGGYGHDEETQADLLVAWLRTAQRPWLVVLDDVDDPADLDGLWPIGDRGRSVVTTRRRDAPVLRPDARMVPVGMFSAAESVDYLRSRLSVADPAQAPADAELADLAERLGHFPLALSQAAAFLLDSRTSVAAYRRLLDDRRERLVDLFPSSSPADGHARTVASTWQLAAQRAAALARPGVAQRMLELVAVLAPEGVPQEVVLTEAACEWVGGTAREALAALRALHRLSLVNHDGATVATHALVQRAVLEAAPDQPGLARAAADALEQAWAVDGGRHLAALYDSVTALRRAAGDHLWHERMHPVLRRIGDHLAGLGRVAAAQQATAQLLAQARGHLGEQHRDVLFLRMQAARADGELGRVAESYAALTGVRQDAQRLLGADDPETLAARVHEARHRLELGAAAAALADLVRVADDVTRALGAGHPTALTVRRHVALCRGLSGDAAGARADYAALAEDLARLRGPSHLDTLITHSELGRWIGETGDAAGAVHTYEGAVAGLEELLGRLHHQTLQARHNLAYWRALAGQPAAAVPEFAVAAGDARQALGPRHPTTLTFQANLAYWRGRSGAASAGAELAEVGAVVAEVLGPDHPRTLRIRQQRAELGHGGGDRAAAVAELAGVLADMRRVQGAEHPRTREVAALLADWSGETA
ncbi:tetratricopeptide repeat protein [Catellatospora sp. TT07R-123]|uniref:NB-ARC domain-containing protein n=1 Tax=Catellatospora sp. TT07R-123 TaxID=2733863 RepID=UPI001B172E7B|nr:NB-ARC domain-containing protein [Catellatospora sp. TT07R-123]GHJ43841.1 tetratricopeptide repeat protein [Catellatospora sp. TT07R-123]